MPRPAPAHSAADFVAMFERVKTWGRWGAADERGTLNYIRPEHVCRAATLVREGLCISLALPINTGSAPDNPMPALHFMLSDHRDPDACSMATDFIATPVHGNSQTHLDALCHVAYQGQLYNGVAADAVSIAGSRALSVMAYASGIVGRGLLLDIPRIRDVEWLEPGDAVTAEDLLLAERAEGVELGEGDIMVFRTGHHRRRVVLGPWDSSDAGSGRAGLDIDAIDLLYDRHVSAFLPDGDGETIPSPVAGVKRPIHALQVAAMGMAACDNLDLEALARACAKRGRYEFLVVMCPLAIGGGTGSPLNPIAVM